MKSWRKLMVLKIRRFCRIFGFFLPKDLRKWKWICKILWITHLRFIWHKNFHQFAWVSIYTPFCINMSKKSREILGIFPRNLKMAIQNIPFIVEWGKFSAFSAKFTSSLSFTLNMRRSVKCMQKAIPRDYRENSHGLYYEHFWPTQMKNTELEQGNDTLIFFLKINLRIFRTSPILWKSVKMWNTTPSLTRKILPIRLILAFKTL